MRFASLALLVREPHQAKTPAYERFPDDIDSYWDQYQNEVIKKFYGNEPKAKKPLSKIHLKPGSIIVLGLTGELEMLLETFMHA